MVRWHGSIRVITVVITSGSIGNILTGHVAIIEIWSTDIFIGLTDRPILIGLTDILIGLTDILTGLTDIIITCMITDILTSVDIAGQTIGVVEDIIRFHNTMGQAWRYFCIALITNAGFPISIQNQLPVTCIYDCIPFL